MVGLALHRRVGPLENYGGHTTGREKQNKEPGRGKIQLGRTLFKIWPLVTGVACSLAAYDYFSATNEHGDEKV